MIRMPLVRTVLLVLISANITYGQFREPHYAPAQQEVIRSPKIVAKTQQSSRNEELLKLVDEAIDVTSRRYLVANEHSPWQIYHGMNAYRRDFMVDYKGKLVPAIDWISTTNPHFRGKPWFEKTVHGGRAHRFTKPYHFEGHPNQSLALMVLCNLAYEHTFETDEGPITVRDIVNNAKADLNPREELTWTLWFLAHYLDSDETWKTRYGQTWSLERLVEDQIATQVNKAACGGTHNLYALTVARNNHVRDGGTIRGVWLQADQKIKRYLVAAKSLQRRDGSFPTSYFRGYGSPKSFSEQIASSGHMMEWIVVASEEKDLDDEWIERGIRYISEKLIKYRNESAECGPLYHAVSSLILYRQRMNGTPWPEPAQEPEEPTRQIEPAPLADQSSQPSREQSEASSEPRRMRTGDQEPDRTAEKPDQESLSDQSRRGALSIGIDDLELRKAEPEKSVEILAAPEDDRTVK